MEMTDIELKARKVEFLKGLRDLIQEYCAIVEHNGEEFYVVTDGYRKDSWEEATTLDLLLEENIDKAIEELNN